MRFNEVLEKNNKTQIAILFFGSYFIFWIYSLLGIPDYWGDAYHNVYMSWLTAENDWIYSDYKGRHLAWLPLHTYTTGIWMWMFDSFSLQTVHYFNRLIGSGTVIWVFLIAQKLTTTKSAFLTSLLLVVTPYWILFSNLNMSEALTAFFLLAVLWAVLFQKYQWAFLFTFLGFFTRYEFSVLIAVFGISYLYKSRNFRQFWI